MDHLGLVKLLGLSFLAVPENKGNKCEENIVKETILKNPY